MPVICKIMSQQEWDVTLGVGQPYVATSDADLRDGFIHCSTNEQLIGTLNKWYREVDSVLVAEISEEGLTSDLKWEPNATGELFPHIYGPIVPEAVAGAYKIERDAAGDFHLPAELEGV